MKHVGKMKNNSARVAVAYRTIPGDAHSALVIGTTGLGDANHDALMSLIESDAGQQANELADVLAVRRFPDGAVMLSWLHARGHLKKVPTNLVIMTPNSQTQIPLNELNELIAKQKGVSIEDLAVQEEGKSKETKASRKTEEVVAEDYVVTESVGTVNEDVTAKDLRSMADKLFKEAQALRKKADELDPPAKKATKAKAEVE